MRVRTPLRLLEPRVPDLSLTAANTACLVLDLQPEVVDPEAGLGAAARTLGVTNELGEIRDQIGQIVPNVVRVAGRCRALGMPVVGLAREDLGPAGEQAVPALAGLEPLYTHRFRRRTVCALVDGGLAECLTARDCRHLILMGVFSEDGIWLTARNASDRGFGVIIVTDGTAGSTWHLQEDAMNRVVAGRVKTRSTARLLDRLALLEGAGAVVI